jgi:hypothetical protein
MQQRRGAIAGMPSFEIVHLTMFRKASAKLDDGNHQAPTNAIE